MRDLDDVRRTLEDHGASMVDPGLVARSGSVRRRVALARRRRQVVASVATVAAVAAVVAGAYAVASPRQDRVQPAQQVVGLTAPDRLVALGYDYDYEEGSSGRGATASLTLTTSDQPRLVTWATSGDDQGVVVEAPSLGAPTDFDDPDFANWVYVPAGSGGTVTVTAHDGETGLASYTLGGGAPAGVTKDGVTFRQDAALGTLAGATIGDVGVADVSADATASSRALVVSYFCAGAPVGAVLHVSIDDGGQDPYPQGVCSTTPPADPASFDTTDCQCTSIGFTPWDPDVIQTEPGQKVHVRFYLTRGADGPLLQDPGVRVGLGLYATDEPADHVDRALPREFDAEGHRWHQVQRTVATDSSSTLVGNAPAGRGATLAVAYGDLARSPLTVDFGGGRPVVSSQAGGLLMQIVSPSQKVTLSSDGNRSYRDDRLAVAFYERAD